MLVMCKPVPLYCHFRSVEGRGSWRQQGEWGRNWHGDSIYCLPVRIQTLLLSDTNSHGDSIYIVRMRKSYSVILVCCQNAISNIEVTLIVGTWVCCSM